MTDNPLPMTIIPAVAKRARDGKEYVILLIVIHRTGLERMFKADPAAFPGAMIAEIAERSLGDIGCTHLHDIEIKVAYEEDGEAFWRVCEEKGPKDIAAYIERGHTITEADKMGEKIMRGMVDAARSGVQH